MTSPPRSSSDFYLHEDDWGMIALEADENRVDRARVVGQAAAHAEAHRAPDGIGWTAMYVAPEPKVALATRAITVGALAGALGPDWTPFATVTSGYSTYREPVAQGYAFVFGPDRHAVIYGTRDRELVTALCLVHPVPALAATLYRLGTTFRLILCDLWRDVTVELASPSAVARYLADDE